MVKRVRFGDADCPVARSLDAIGDWWSLLIITQICIAGQRRFGDIQQSLGMAKNILSARLQKLVDEAILRKVPASDGSAFHEYILTEKGSDLYKVLVALRQWGEKHFCDGKPMDHFLADKAKQQPIPEIEVRSQGGKVLGASDLMIVERDGAKSESE